jgi:hypothetical protein
VSVSLHISAEALQELISRRSMHIGCGPAWDKVGYDEINSRQVIINTAITVLSDIQWVDDLLGWGKIVLPSLSENE